MSQTSKRREILTTGIVTALTALAASGPSTAAGATTGARKKVADLKEFKPGQPVAFTYPQDEAAVALDVGRAMPGGVGPNKSIVAFSALCQHMGCPVAFDPKSDKLVCPCHSSVFDPALGGQCIEGPSTRGLPRVVLRVEGPAVYATGIEGGVVYGRACNRA